MKVSSLVAKAWNTKLKFIFGKSIKMHEFYMNQGWGAGAACFWPLGAGVAWKKKEKGARAGAAPKKYRKPEPLQKNIGSRSRRGKKYAAPEAVPRR